MSKGNYSTIGYCELVDPLTLGKRNDSPILFPQFDYETQGLEDPRLVKIEDLFYLTYTGYDGVNALGALALSKDLKHFEKHGLIVPQITYEEFSHLANSKVPSTKSTYATMNLGVSLKKKERKDWCGIKM